MKRKLLSILALLCLTVSSAWADVVDSGNCGTSVTWTLTNDGVMTISGTGDMTNYPGASNQPWKAYRSSITSVVIGDGVTSIGNYAFAICDDLTSVTIGNSVETIGNNAFSSCSDLSSVNIGSGVTSIGNSAFISCSKLSSVTIPDNVTSIGNYAFSSSGLTSVIIPDKVTTISNNAFQFCSNLTSVTIGNSVTTIGDYAFTNSGLTSVTIPTTVTSIGNSAFYGCEKLTEISVDAGNTKYSSDGDVLFNKEKTTLIQYPCYKNATSYEIPSSVTSINANAFRECTSLTTVTIPSTVTSIGNNAFRNCTSLTTATIPDKVTSIGNYAFSNSDLTSVTIPNSVTTIGNYAFYNCINLSSVTIYSPSLITYGSDAFKSNKSGRKIYVFNDCVDTYKGKASTISVDENDILPITLAANEGATGEYWTTYYNDLANAKVPSGAQAFKATLSGTTLTLTEIEDGIITKGTGVVIKSTSASVLPESSATGSSDTNANNLQGTMTSITNPGNAFVLNKTNEGGVGFYKLSSGGTIGAHKAYLTYSGSLAREFFAFNEATGINSATLTNSEKVNNEVYDLQGRRVVNPTKGLYIVNGKKVIKR